MLAQESLLAALHRLMRKRAGRVAPLVGIFNEVTEHHPGLSAVPFDVAAILLEATMMVFSASPSRPKFRDKAAHLVIRELVIRPI